MAFDETLARRVRKLLPNNYSFSEKKMFGGLAFMLDGKMCCGIIENKLVARVGPDYYEVALNKSGVKPMDFTGRPLKGYVYVTAQGLTNDAKLRSWIRQSISFVSTLSSKKTKQKRKTISQFNEEEDANHIKLSQLINFGPVTLREFREMGLTTFGQLEGLGWEEVCRKWVESFPKRLNANAFIGIITTLEGIPWTQASSSDRARARNLVNQLKQEYGIQVRERRSK